MPRILVVPVLSLLAFPALADRPPDESWTFTFRFENDLFADTDRFYTNGIKLNWVSPELQWFQDLSWFRNNNWLSHWGNRLVEMLPFNADRDRQRNLSLSVGQMMFTPEDIQRRELIVDDRPYAGWLYGSVAFHSKTYRRLDTFELQAGLTGPWSLAEETQDLVHELRGIEKAKGWNNQIGTEPGFAAVYEYKYRIVPRHDFAGKWGVDAITHLGATLGTVYTYANFGLEARAGWNIPADFGTGLIRPAGETDAPSDTRDPRYAKDRREFSAHLFAAASGRLVARDVFLDGNTFSDSHEVDHRPLVGDLLLGVSLVWRNFKLSYSQVLRTEEFERQRGTQKFGSVSLSFTY
ncbi:MAG: lipid A deacylase LpxR family protein [Gammaproteobacteria bacterium]|nr:lipid A deacylase LpxR family protein [Gammaproteobacteria bacterium]